MPNLQPSTPFTLRPATPADLPEMQHLFVETIESICKNDYSPQHIAIWVSGVNNKQRWQQIMDEQIIILAEITGQLAGFITLENNRYIDLLYVHKNHQRLGVANLLYQHIEQIARQSGIKLLSAAVSITARPFFLLRGFTMVMEQQVLRDSVAFTNYMMEKRIISLRE